MIDSLEKEIQALGKYFIGLEQMNNIFVVRVKFLEKWKSYNSEDDKIKVDCDRDNLNVRWFYGEVKSVTFIEILKHIQEVIKNNVELDDKKVLWEEKVNELKKMFSTLDLKTLQTLIFKYKEPRKKINKVKKTPVVKEVGVEVEVVEEKNIKIIKK